MDPACRNPNGLIGLQCRFFLLVSGVVGVLVLFLHMDCTWADDIPIGRAYQGPKCSAAVGDFAIQIPGAPVAVGDGLREMLMTALFEINYFDVVERMDTAGISAEQLLSDSFMADADSILNDIGMIPARIMIYGTLVGLEGGGAGLRVKMPWVPMTLGGKYHEAKAVVEIKAVDNATGRVIAVDSIQGSAVSTGGSFGAIFQGIPLPVELEMFENTPLELCLRDCILRGVLSLCSKIPKEYFQH
jgi:curli biogenesis system outer membrane secretion channel CsgG